MAIKEWKKDEKGVILHPITGFEAVFRANMVGVRMLLGDRSGGTSVGSTQIGFSPEQARALAKALEDSAERAERVPFINSPPENSGRS